MKRVTLLFAYHLFMFSRPVSFHALTWCRGYVTGLCASQCFAVRIHLRYCPNIHKSTFATVHQDLVTFAYLLPGT